MEGEEENWFAEAGEDAGGEEVEEAFDGVLVTWDLEIQGFRWKRREDGAHRAKLTIFATSPCLDMPCLFAFPMRLHNTAYKLPRIGQHHSCTFAFRPL